MELSGLENNGKKDLLKNMLKLRNKLKSIGSYKLDILQEFDLLDNTRSTYNIYNGQTDWVA